MSVSRVIVGLPEGVDREQATRRAGIQPSEELDGVNGFVVEVPEEELDQFLPRLPEEASFRIDGPIRFIQPEDAEFREREAPPPGTTPHISRPEGIEALHRRGFTGKGVTVAVIDSGLHPHADFGGRIKEFVDMTSSRTTPYDPHGHGTNVAGILAGDGEHVKGVAPEAELVGVRITNAREAIRGLEWVIENKERLGIDVVNMSLGDHPRLSSQVDPFAQMTQKAIDAGLTVIVAAGNECLRSSCPGTISVPGTLPDAITVGALDDRGTPELEDDGMYSQSSHGPTRIDGHPKPDLVASGVGVYGPRSPDSELDRSHWPHWAEYLALDGTSQATPMVAGLAVLMLQANPRLNHHTIKSLLTQTADPLPGIKPEAQGAGRLDPEEAVERALKPGPRPAFPGPVPS